MIKKDGDEGECSYCEQVAPSWTVESLSDSVEVAFEHHFVRTPNEPDEWQTRLLADSEFEYDWYREGTPVLDAITELTDITETAANDVLEILAERHYDRHLARIGEELEFDEDSYYERKGTSDEGWQHGWHNFEQSLKSEARFFSRVAMDYLADIFADIDELKTHDGRNVVVDAGPKTDFEQLYRARVFQSKGTLEEALCYPDRHLGPPPSRFASSGRMNARGIAVFYGATEAETALAEVRPPVGSEAMVAYFTIVRPLRLLDLGALEDVYEQGSFLDPHYKERLERATFLRSLGRRMTKPVMPDDQDADYLVTQAIADFLATENRPQLDGIIFDSVQSKSGLNVVLFHKAARVEKIEYPEGTEIRAKTGYWSEDGWAPDFNVSVKLPRQEELKAPQAKRLFAHLGLSSDASRDTRFMFDVDDDQRDVTLRVDPESVTVHEIEGVQVHSRATQVKRWTMPLVNK